MVGWLVDHQRHLGWLHEDGSLRCPPVRTGLDRRTYKREWMRNKRRAA